MANRRFEMYQYRQVLVQMRLGETDRQLARAGLMGRRKAGPLLAIRLHFISRKSLGGIQTGLMDAFHDQQQTMVDFFARPGKPQAVLAHFQAGSERKRMPRDDFRITKKNMKEEKR